MPYFQREYGQTWPFFFLGYCLHVYDVYFVLLSEIQAIWGILFATNMPSVLTHCLSLLLSCSPCLCKLLTSVTGWRVVFLSLSVSKAKVFHLNIQMSRRVWSFDSFQKVVCLCCPQRGQSSKSFLQVGRSGLWGNQSVNICVLLIM